MVNLQEISLEVCKNCSGLMKEPANAQTIENKNMLKASLDPAVVMFLSVHHRYFCTWECLVDYLKEVKNEV